MKMVGRTASGARMLVVVAMYAKLAAAATAALVASALLVNIVQGATKHHLKRRILQGIPGPRRQSLFTGNLVELFDATRGSAFYDSLSALGRIVKIHGLFGVRDTSSYLIHITLIVLQDVSLVISDPRALAHMLVKDPNNYPSIDVAGSIE